MPEEPQSNSKAARTAAAGGAVLSLGAALVGSAAPAGAAPFSVTTNADSGEGSLREAILDANAAPGADTISFAPGLGTITLATEIDIDDPVSITGPATISGGGVTRIFSIDEAESVTITGVTLQDGSADDGGAIDSDETQFHLVSSTVTGSEATGGNGGGLRISGTDVIEITDSVISGNSANEGSEYGDYGNGGGAYFHTDDESLVISGSTFSGNTADGYGGGFATVHIYDVSIDTTTISGNTAGETGGGAQLHAHDGEASATVSVTSSTVSGNSSEDEGGGLFVYDFAYVGIAHTTVAGNTASEGGGVWIEAVTAGALSHTLIGDNSADAGADLGGDANELELSNSLVEAAIVDGLVNDAGGNVLGQDAALAPLGSNGGPNQTHALTAGSPALDGGDPGFAPPPAADQRGLPRVQGEAIDIGAYEAQAETPVEPTPTDPPAAQPGDVTPRFTG